MGGLWHMTATEIHALDTAATTAYDQLAMVYDTLTEDYGHEAWLSAIEHVAKRHGLRGTQVLDIACGTGSSFLPLVARGYQVSACDGSREMISRARAKAPDVLSFVADMRALSSIGSFDLITCLDDAVNYLLSTADLERFFAGVARNLATSGLLIFDANSLGLYRNGFGGDWVKDHPSAFIAWSAPHTPALEAGECVCASIHIFAETNETLCHTVSRHEQRHWPSHAFSAAAEKAGLTVEAVYGQHRGARLESPFHEIDHQKALYVVKRAHKGR